MAMILSLETSGTNCSVCISDKQTILAVVEKDSGSFSHAEKLHVFIEQALAQAKITFKDLQAIAVSKGPGSYTGLRIGVSAAKGLCFSLDIPLIAVETLQALALQQPLEENQVVAPLLDARRMEVYTSVFDITNTKVQPTQALIITEESFATVLKDKKVFFIGDGAPKCKTILTHENAVFTDTVHMPSAKEVAVLAYKKFKTSDFEDVAYFEPYYLKDFVVTPAKKKF